MRFKKQCFCIFYSTYLVIALAKIIRIRKRVIQTLAWGVRKFDWDIYIQRPEGGTVVSDFWQYLSLNPKSEHAELNQEIALRSSTYVTCMLYLACTCKWIIITNYMQESEEINLYLLCYICNIKILRNLDPINFQFIA